MKVTQDWCECRAKQRQTQQQRQKITNNQFDD